MKPSLHLLFSLSIDGKIILDRARAMMLVRMSDPQKERVILTDLPSLRSLATAQLNYLPTDRLLETVQKATKVIWVLGTPAVHEKVLAEDWVESLHLCWTTKFSDSEADSSVVPPFQMKSGLRRKFKLQTWVIFPSGVYGVYRRKQLQS